MSKVSIKPKKIIKKDISQVKKETITTKLLFLVEGSTDLFESIVEITKTKQGTDTPHDDTILDKVTDLLSKSNDLFNNIKITENQYKIKVTFNQKNCSGNMDKIDEFMVLLSQVLNCNVYFDNDSTFIIF